MADSRSRVVGSRSGPASAASLEARQDRAAKMASMYLQGITLQKIGDQFGLTRERVRQILVKLGIRADQGGAHVVAEAKRESASKAADARYLAKYGFPFEVVRQLQKDGVTYAFQKQRQTARIRGIDWKLTFQQWFSVWDASGKLSLRGKGRGKYVMSRVSDSGCYEVGNVHIQLSTENSREAVAKWAGKTKANKGVFHLYPGRELAWDARIGRVSLGFFKTEAEAVEARTRYLEQHPESKSRHRGYAHIRGQAGRKDRYQVMVGKKYVGSFATPEEALAARAAFLSAQATPLPTAAGDIHGAVLENRPA